MGKKLLSLFGFIPLFLLFLMLWTCTMNNGKPYSGDHPELYTVAINSFLGSAGYGSNGEIVFSAEAGVIETDDYGRVLFYYHEGINDEGCGYGILQMQQGGYAYFYEDESVICAANDWTGNGAYTHDEWFSQKEIDAFKALNDWNQPINEAKCVKRKIVDRKPESKLNLKEADFDKAAKEYFAENEILHTEKSVHGYDQYFVSDDYGREIHYLYCVVRGFSNPHEYILALMFNPDGTCAGSAAVMTIDDPLHYHEALKEFKLRNGWNTEYSDARA